jgi:hypothetical protein
VAAKDEQGEEDDGDNGNRHDDCRDKRVVRAAARLYLVVVLEVVLDINVEDRTLGPRVIIPPFRSSIPRRRQTPVIIALWVAMMTVLAVSLRILTFLLMITNDGVVTPFLVVVVVVVFALIVRRWIVNLRERPPTRSWRGDNGARLVILGLLMFTDVVKVA